jgi:predicted branched-subunit amino acid permease
MSSPPRDIAVPNEGASPHFTTDFRTPRAAFIGGCREAIGAPVLVLGASYVGFGSLVRESGLGLAVGLFSTLTTWALPGQVAAVELFAAGASLLPIFIAVALTNARMLPMTVTLLPVLHRAGRPQWKLYLAAHLIAVTGWAVSMLRCPDMPREQRMSFFVGFAGTLLTGSMLGTAIGYFLSTSVPPAVALGLVFVNPIYFMLVFLVDLRHRGRVLALVLGACLAPLLHLVMPTWGLLVSGLLAGGFAFAADRALRRRHG